MIHATKRLTLWLGILLAAVWVLAACSTGQPTAPAAQEEMPATQQEETTSQPAETAADPCLADGTVVVGTNAEYRPFEFVDENGNIVGFDIDLMNALAERAGFQVEYVNTKWDGIFVALANGEFEAVISAVTITPERAEVVDFTDPYFNAGQAMAVRADDDRFSGPEDLTEGVVVGVQLGTTGDIWVTDNTNATVQRFEETPLAIQALANGDVDVVVADAPTLADYIRANPELNLKIVGQPFTDEFYGIAVRKECPGLRDALNAALAAVKADGTYDQIYNKWFGTPTSAAPAQEVPQIGGTVVVGTNAEYRPFEFVDENGNIVGFDIDLMNALAERAGFQVEYVNTKWDGIFVALANGEFDAVISAVTITPERAEVVDFTDPYFNAGQAMAVRADDDRFSGPEDLTEGVVVGVQLGTTGDIWVTDNTNATVQRFEEIPLAIQALANGDVDAVVTDAPTLADYIRANPELNLKIVGQPFTDEFYGIAVRKDRKDLLEALNAALAAVKADGTYDQIYNKWFGTQQ